MKIETSATCPNMRHLMTAILLGLLTCTFQTFADQDIEFNTPVINSTVKLISGPVIGTGFLVSYTNSPFIMLVSAAHVLTNMGERMTIVFRRQDSDEFHRLPIEITLRTNGVPLFVAHTNADVAAIDLPAIGVRVQTMLGPFGNDDFFRDFKIHPGDEVRVVGFPRGYEYNAGFPVLRSGRIASFPLIPAKKVRTYLIDFPVFPGNSGGPVFMSERRFMTGSALESVTIRKLIGLVSQSVQSTEQIQSQTELVVRTQSLGLGLVVPGEFIQDVLDEIAARRK